MVTTTSSGGEGATSSTSPSSSPFQQQDDAQGYLLLTLEDVTVVQVFEGERNKLASGELRLQCLALPIDPSVGRRANPFADQGGDPSKDLWLAIQVGDSFEFALVPTQKIDVVVVDNAAPSSSLSSSQQQRQGGRTFRIPFEAVPGAHIHLELPPPITQADKEDVETFEVLLRQYGCLSAEDAKAVGVSGQKAALDVGAGGSGREAQRPAAAAAAPPIAATAGLRRRMQLPRHDSGRLVLVDDSTGEVVGEVDRAIDVQGDSAATGAAQEGDEKAAAAAASPVVVDFGTIRQGLDNTPVVVKTVKPEEMQNDWMLKGAHYLSQGILGIGNSVSTYSTKAAERYVASTTPRAEPVQFSPAAKAGIRSVHNVSAVGIRVTRKTLDVVTSAAGGVIRRVADPVVEEVGSAREEYQAMRKDRLEEKRRASLSAQQEAYAAMDGGAPPPPYDDATTAATESPKPQKSFWKRAWQAAEVIGSSLEATTQTVLNSTGDAATSMAGHKYGPEAARATQLIGGSARNVTMVFVDVRGVGRSVIVKSAKRGVGGAIKARMADGTEVAMVPDAQGQIHIANDEASAREAAEEADDEVGAAASQTLRNSAPITPARSTTTVATARSSNTSSPAPYTTEPESLDSRSDFRSIRERFEKAS